MQVVILCGGLGTRLKSVNPDLPKPLVPVAGKPFLAHQIDMLKGHGFSDFLFLPSYRSEAIVGFLRKQKGLSARWSVEPSPMGTAGALKLAEPLLAEEFFLLNGDSYLDLDYAAVETAFRDSGAEMLLVVYDNATGTDVPNNVEVNARNEVVRYERGGGAGEGLTHVDAGVLVMKKSGVGGVPAGRPCSMEQDVYPPLIRRRALRAFPSSQRFYDIGTPERLREFEALFAKG